MATHIHDIEVGDKVFLFGQYREVTDISYRSPFKASEVYFDGHPRPLYLADITRFADVVKPEPAPEPYAVGTIVDVRYSDGTPAGYGPLVRREDGWYGTRTDRREFAEDDTVRYWVDSPTDTTRIIFDPNQEA